MRWIRTPGFKLLLAGIAAVWLSELFFAAGGMRRWVPLFGGLVIALAGWGEIARRGWRPALAAGALAFASAWTLTVCSPALVRQSFRFFIHENRDDLARAVAIMGPVRMEHRVRSDDPCPPGLSPRGCAELKRTMHRFGAYAAWKEGPTTVFQTYGWVNVRGGVLYCPRDDCESRGRRHVEGAWYSWWQ